MYPRFSRTFLFYSCKLFTFGQVRMLPHLQGPLQIVLFSWNIFSRLFFFFLIMHHQTTAVQVFTKIQELFLYTPTPVFHRCSL